MDYVSSNNTQQFNQFFDEIVSKSKKSNVNLKTLVNIDLPIHGDYLIIKAAAQNNLIIVKRLIKQQANVSVIDSGLFSKNALYYACRNSNSEMCELIMMHGGDPNMQADSLTCAAFLGNLKIMKYLFNDEKRFKCSYDWVC